MRYKAKKSLVTIVEPNEKIEAEPIISDISIDRLIEDGLLVLCREMAMLKALSIGKKLDRAHSQDLRDHIKLLFELKDRESDLLKNLSEEQLQKILKTLADEHESQQASASARSDETKE